MRNKTFTYFTAVFLLLLFFSKDILTLVPHLINKEEWVSTHEYANEDEPDNTKNEAEGNLKLSEAREFLAEHDFTQNINAFSLDQKQKLRPVNSSFERTFYLSIPTPPPDKA